MPGKFSRPKKRIIRKPINVNPFYAINKPNRKRGKQKRLLKALKGGASKKERQLFKQLKGTTSMKTSLETRNKARQTIRLLTQKKPAGSSKRAANKAKAEKMVKAGKLKENKIDDLISKGVNKIKKQYSWLQISETDVLSKAGYQTQLINFAKSSLAMNGIEQKLIDDAVRRIRKRFYWKGKIMATKIKTKNKHKKKIKTKKKTISRKPYRQKTKDGLLKELVEMHSHGSLSAIGSASGLDQPDLSKLTKSMNRLKTKDKKIKVLLKNYPKKIENAVNQKIKKRKRK